MEYWWLLGRASEVVGLLTFASTTIWFFVQRVTLRRIEHQNKEGAAAIKKLARIRRISEAKDESLWSRPLGEAKLDYHRRLDTSIPIMLIANLKGGVGKTTIAGNLAAYFADPQDGAPPERVLVIDMDYQGSLTALLDGESKLSDQKVLDLEHQRAELLISGLKDGTWLRDTRSVNTAAKLSNLHYISSNYTLADIENRLLLRWLLDEADGDVRLNLANVLLSVPVQEHFDRVIIDSAPRMTLGFVAAATSCTHVLVPSIMNEGSSRSVKDTMVQLEFLRRRVATHMKAIGIVPSKTHAAADGNWIDSEKKAVDDLKGAIESMNINLRSDFILEGCKIRDSAQIRNAAGNRLAYMEASDGTAGTDARPNFARLGAEVRRAVG